MAAAISGAIEGFLDAVEEHDLAHEVEGSAKVAGELVRESATEWKTQADTPEMKMLGEKLGTAASAVGSAAVGAKDAMVGAKDAVKDSAVGAAHSVRSTAHNVKETVADAAHDVRQSVHNVKEGVKVRAGAVAETGRRARVAPRRVGSELGQAMGAWWNGLVRAAMTAAMIGVLGIVTLILVTIALVVTLNRLVGDPWGTWIVVALYAVAIGIAASVMKSQKAKAKHETKKHVQNSKDEIRHVTAPVRAAFRGRGRAGL